MLLRNTIGVLLGLLSATLIITVVINIDPKWVEYNGNFPFKRWQMVVTTARDEFFIALLIAGGVASIVGGIITSLIVKEAKQAYAIFIGFILFLIAVADIIFVTDHPTFYEIGIFFTFFPFSWLGGKIVDSIFKIKKMNKWNFISEEKEVDSIIEASNHKTQIIFKHSVSCGISQHAKSRLDTDLLALAEKADLHYLDLLKFRNVSNYIAQQLEVLHQSPQIIVLKDKKVIQVLTHSAIQTDKILPNLV